MWSILYIVVQRKRVLLLFSWIRAETLLPALSWILDECKLSCKIVKNCILSKVCMIIEQSLKVPFTSGEMYKKKYIKVWFTCHATRFVGKIFVGLFFFILAWPLRQRNATYKLQRVNWLPPRTIVSYNRPLYHKIHQRMYYTLHRAYFQLLRASETLNHIPLKVRLVL